MIRSLHAELRKLVTLPAVPLTVGSTWAVTALLATTAAGPPGVAVGYVQAGFLVLGVLAATAEYEGQVRTSLLCVPRRVEYQIAQALAVALVSVPAAAVTAVLARAGLGAAGYLVLTAVLASTVGTLVRRPLPALGLLLGHYFIAGPLLRTRPAIGDHLPGTSGLWLPGADDPLRSAVVAAAWTMAGLLAAVLTVRHRDA
jgi:hypothetical protein